MEFKRRWKRGAATVALALGLLVMPDARAGSEQGVTVQTFQFKPTPVVVPAGTKVSFTNQDDITHTVTSGTPDSPDGRFRHRLEGKGSTASVELGKSGVYPYFCERHRSMRGEIRVK
jgi:plastocyanin